MINENIAKSMLEEFDGCDSYNPGSPNSPAIWLFGIEPGSSKKDQELERASRASNIANISDADYSINTQIKWPFNQKAFKLLAAMKGYQVEKYCDFAQSHQPFVKGSEGYFKGNLYPYACNSLDAWPDDVIKEIGTSDKSEYRQWCRQYRLPAIKQWVDKYQPKIFIGVGITCRSEFSLATLGKQVEFKEKVITVNSHNKHIFYFVEGLRKLVVVPHFIGRYGLNSNKSLQLAGEFIAGL
jgi:hypothetical protein